MSEPSLRNQVARLPGDMAQHVHAVLASVASKSVATNILIVAGVLGAAGLAFAAPNALKLLAPFMRRKHGRPLVAREQRKKLLKTIYYLKETGQIKIEQKEEGLIARLTEKGKLRFNKIQTDIHRIAKPSQWDGFWWLVAADIPTKDYKIAADLFRRKLKELQFYPLQRTFWMHPFDPRKELEYITRQYDIGRFVTIMEIRRLDVQDKKVLLEFFRKKGLL